MKDTIEEEKRKQRLKQLFAVGREIGYSKETLQEISSSMGMGERLSFLTEAQIQRILNSLKQGHPEAFKRSEERNKKKSIPKSQLFSIPSADQKGIIEILLSQVNKIAPYKISLESMAQKTFKIPSEKLSFHQYQSLIEALKSVKSRFEKRNKP
ncbi:PF06252 family protein [Leptospira weilii str. UI 13098]|uniref:PF06252 family protein n=1 Tax=Leptospira weilii str. UI 13098 TaxID=1088542 RepID=M6QHR1_9LEPT|nr:PF06252 family protein [Leptospira weilii str. UI 13098]